MIPWCSFIPWYNQLLWCIYFWSSLYLSSHHNAGTLSVWLTTQDCWSWLSLMILCCLLQIPHFLWLFSIPSSFQKHLLPTCSTSEAMFWGFKCKTFYKVIWFLSHRVQSNEAKIHKQGDEWSNILSFNFLKTLSIIKKINIMFQSSWYICWGGGAVKSIFNIYILPLLPTSSKKPGKIIKFYLKTKIGNTLKNAGSCFNAVHS